MSRLRGVVWVVVGMMAAACAPTPGPGAAGSAEPLAGSSWTLTELNGQPPVSGGTAPTLLFAADEPRVSGNTGCNLYNGPYTQSGDGLRMGPLVSTRRACVDEGANRQEAAFLQALESTTRFSRTADALVLYAADRAVARFRPGAP